MAPAESLPPTRSGRFCPGGAAAGELLALIMALLHLETSHLDVATARHLRRFRALAGSRGSVLCVFLYPRVLATFAE